MEAVVETGIEKKRYHLIDELRGFAVVCMVFYHGFYTLAAIFDSSAGEKLLNFFMPAEPFFAGLFIFLSGIASQLTRSNLKRGLKLLGVAVTVSIVTFLLTFVGFDQMIWFGILHLLALAMIIVSGINPAIRKISPLLGVLLCALLYIATMRIEDGLLGLPLVAARLPEGLNKLPFLFPLGIKVKGFYSADYFPLFPWIFVFLAGACIGVYALQDKFPKFIERKRVPPLSFVGRHALIIYILHQPVLFGLFSLVSWIIK